MWCQRDSVIPVRSWMCHCGRSPRSLPPDCGSIRHGGECSSHGPLRIDRVHAVARAAGAVRGASRSLSYASSGQRNDYCVCAPQDSRRDVLSASTWSQAPRGRSLMRGVSSHRTLALRQRSGTAAHPACSAVTGDATPGCLKHGSAPFGLHPQRETLRMGCAADKPFAARTGSHCIPRLPPGPTGAR